MSPANLGFDPGFLLHQEGGEDIPSYRIPLSFVIKGHTHLPWVFSMPSADAGTEREKFITIHELSVNRAEVVRGRGTRLWVVCRLRDYPKRLDSNTEVGCSNYVALQHSQ